MFFKVIGQFFSKVETKERMRVAEDVLYGRLATESSVEIAKAVAELSHTYCNLQSEAILDLGTFLFVKKKDENGEFRVYTRQLTVEDRIRIENEGDFDRVLQEFFKSPDHVKIEHKDN